MYIKEILKKSIPWEATATLASLCFAFDHGQLNSYLNCLIPFVVLLFLCQSYHYTRCTMT